MGNTSSKEIKYSNFGTNRTELMINGYIRSNLQEVKCDMIIHLCIKFYKEKYEWTIKSEDLQLSDDNQTVTRIADTKTPDYDHIGEWNPIATIDNPTWPKGKYSLMTYTLKINKCKKYGKGIRFGILTDDNYPYIEIDNWGWHGSAEQMIQAYKIDEKAIKCGSGDIIRIYCDTGQQRIGFQVNTRKIQLPFAHASTASEHCRQRMVNDNYQICVELSGKNDSVSIIDFQIKYYNIKSGSE